VTRRERRIVLEVVVWVAFAAAWVVTVLCVVSSAIRAAVGLPPN
jgi:hypothetical protein